MVSKLVFPLAFVRLHDTEQLNRVLPLTEVYFGLYVQLFLQSDRPIVHHRLRYVSCCNITSPIAHIHHTSVAVQSARTTDCH